SIAGRKGESRFNVKPRWFHTSSAGVTPAPDIKYDGRNAMVVTVFKNRLRPGVEKEYGAHVAKLLEIAQRMPGFVAIKGYAAEDGEQLILVEFETVQDLA